MANPPQPLCHGILRVGTWCLPPPPPQISRADRCQGNTLSNEGFSVKPRGLAATGAAGAAEPWRDQGGLAPSSPRTSITSLMTGVQRDSW